MRESRTSGSVGAPPGRLGGATRPRGALASGLIFSQPPSPALPPRGGGREQDVRIRCLLSGPFPPPRGGKAGLGGREECGQRGHETSPERGAGEGDGTLASGTSPRPAGGGWEGGREAMGGQIVRCSSGQRQVIS